jgi:hypothetical protein
MKVPRQCPLVLLVKVGCRDGKEVEHGEKMSMVLVYSVRILNLKLI